MSTTETLPAKQPPKPKVDVDVEKRPSDGRPPVLLHAALQEAEFFRKVFCCRMPPGTTAEDMRRPDFWKLTADRLSRHDVIFVLGEDESWEAELRVERSTGAGAEVSVVRLFNRKSFSDMATVLGDGAFITR